MLLTVILSDVLHCFAILLMSLRKVKALVQGRKASKW